MKHSGWISTGVVLALSLVLTHQVSGQVDHRAEAYYLYCLGKMYELQGKGEESLVNYKKAIELDPESAYPHLAMAELYVQANRVQDAVESVRKAVELNEELAGAHRLLGNIYLQQARADERPELLEKSLLELGSDPAKQKAAGKTAGECILFVAQKAKVKGSGWCISWMKAKA